MSGTADWSCFPNFEVGSDLVSDLGLGLGGSSGRGRRLRGRVWVVPLSRSN